MSLGELYFYIVVGLGFIGIAVVVVNVLWLMCHKTDDTEITLETKLYSIGRRRYDMYTDMSKSAEKNNSPISDRPYYELMEQGVALTSEEKFSFKHVEVENVRKG